METFYPFRGEHLAKANEPDVYCDLLDAALSRGRWGEIAEAFLEDLEPDDEPDSETEGEDEDGRRARPKNMERLRVMLEEAKRERAEGPEGPALRAWPGREHAGSP